MNRGDGPKVYSGRGREATLRAESPSARRVEKGENEKRLGKFLYSSQ